MNGYLYMYRNIHISGLSLLYYSAKGLQKYAAFSTSKNVNEIREWNGLKLRTQSQEIDDD